MMTARERTRFRFQIAVIVILANAVIIRWLEWLQP
jgi:hypothetical protein